MDELIPGYAKIPVLATVPCVCHLDAEGVGTAGGEADLFYVPAGSHCATRNQGVGGVVVHSQIQIGRIPVMNRISRMVAGVELRITQIGERHKFIGGGRGGREGISKGCLLYTSPSPRD